MAGVNDRPVESGSGAVNSAPTTVPAGSRRMRTGTRPAFSSNWSSNVVSGIRDASTKAVPTLGCPANGTSLPGVKMRTRAVCDGSAGRQTNVVSE